MKILFFECFSGVSGDLFLSALIDLGLPFDYLNQELKKLGVEGYSIEKNSEIKNGIKGTGIKVNCQESHHHRNFSDIKKILEQSKLNDHVKSMGIDIFHKVAEAEAKIHGKSIDEVHFHEVGALDSIADITGAAIGIDYFKPDRVISTPLEVGSGFADCAHGRFPVPAPATAEILKDIPLKYGNQPFEATTPTGAAIMKTIVDEFTASAELRIKKTAYGVGYHTGNVPNVLRVSQAEPLIRQPHMPHQVIECNLDDMNPELTGYVMDKLFEAGAKDVFITPIIMKKSRNGAKISVLCPDNSRESIMEILLKETTTFGLRFYQVEKTALERDFIKVSTQYGEISVKRAYLNGKIIKHKPEFEDCQAIANKMNIPIHQVYYEIEKAFPKK